MGTAVGDWWRATASPGFPVHSEPKKRERELALSVLDV
jgi:hypothetical protein